MKRIISTILILSLLFFASTLASCGDVEKKTVETAFVKLTTPETWYMFDYGGEALEAAANYRRLIFSKHPLNFKYTYEEQGEEYLLTCQIVFDPKVNEGDFTRLQAPYEGVGVVIVRNENIPFKGALGRWVETETTLTDGTVNRSILVDIPVTNGYVTIDFFGPVADEKVYNEAVKIIESVEITDVKFFEKNPQDDPTRRRN